MPAAARTARRYPNFIFAVIDSRRENGLLDYSVAETFLEGAACFCVAVEACLGQSESRQNVQGRSGIILSMRAGTNCLLRRSDRRSGRNLSPRRYISDAYIVDTIKLGSLHCPKPPRWVPSQCSDSRRYTISMILAQVVLPIWSPTSIPYRQDRLGRNVFLTISPRPSDCILCFPLHCTVTGITPSS